MSKYTLTKITYYILLAVACICTWRMGYSTVSDNDTVNFVKEIHVVKSYNAISIKHHRNDVDTTFQIPLYRFLDDDTGVFIMRMVETMAKEDNFMIHFIKPASTPWSKNGFFLYSQVLLPENYKNVTGVLFTNTGKTIVLLDCDDDLLKNNHIIKTGNHVTFSTEPYSSYVFLPDIGNLTSVLATESNGKVNVYRLYSGRARIQDATWLKDKHLFDWIQEYYIDHGYSDNVDYYVQPYYINNSVR